MPASNIPSGIASALCVRPERPADRHAVRAVNLAAFPTAGEADLVDLLRKSDDVISLVAVHDSRVAGHILFSTVSLDTAPHLRLMGLAPMAVLHALRGRGIGSALVSAGLASCRRRGATAVVVLGHPEYYPRFGFEPAHRLGLRCTYDVPPEVFMAVVLSPGTMEGMSGTVHYHRAFDGL